MISTKTEREAKGRVLALSFLAAALMAASLLLLTANPAYAATFTVNSTRDFVDNNPGDGSCFTGVFVQVGPRFARECTLRAAIQETNATTAADTINFNISGAGPHTISPTSELPGITKPVTINGYSQSGSSPNAATTGTNAVLQIVLDGSNVGSSADGLVLTAPNTTVRGLVINGFRAGVFFDEGDNNVIEGCFIGTDASGTNRRGNGVGVFIDDGAGNLIGGTTLAARNLISGNHTGEGVMLFAAATGNSVQGNLIGTDKNGTDSNLGNPIGVRVLGGSNNTIGGNGAARNTIAFNGYYGVEVYRDEVEAFDPSSAIGNRILFNSIHNNGRDSNRGLGIQLGDEGVTPNDLFDRDTGANTLQNFPVISSATTFGATTTIQGRLHSTPNRTFTLQFFSSPAPDPLGFSEGETFLGQTSVTTRSNGNRSFTFTPARAVPVGHQVTATATGVGGTSEFSRARLVEPPVIG